MAKDPNKKGVFKEFIEFVNKGNAVALAIGVIIGGAFSSIVSSVNKDVISPLIGAILGDQDLTAYRLPLWTAKEYESYADAVSAVGEDSVYFFNGNVYSGASINYGNLIQAIIDFLMIALVLFLIMKITTSIIRHSQKIKQNVVDKAAKLKVQNEVIEEIKDEEKAE